MLTIAQHLAEFAADVAAGRADAQARRMQLYALDTLAVMLAGTVSPSSGPMLRTVLSACGKPEATVMAAGRVTSAWDAALANGAFAHALELDDDHRIAVLHPGAVVVPAALAAAEAANASGLTFLRALLVGYEIACRAARSFRGNLFDHALHPTALCGDLRRRRCRCVAMGLDRDAFVRALGIAGTQAAGLTEWRADGSWIKRLHPGRSAHGGVLAARLSQNGFTGPATIFEGDGGFFRAFTHTGPIDPSTHDTRSGSGFPRARHGGQALSLLPLRARRYRSGAGGCREWHRRRMTSPPSASASIAPMSSPTIKTPKNAVDAQFNVPYAVALALVRKAPCAWPISPRQASRIAAVLALAERIDVEEDAGFTAKYPQDYFVELAIKLRDGTSAQLLSECPSGDPEAKRYRSDPTLLAVRGTCARPLACSTSAASVSARARWRRCVAGLADATTIAELSEILGAPRRGQDKSGIA